ncbi:glycosyltransferase involved in cell wall biosynthesis [Kribbella kalugense]|uniref:Glycosyltransferase involved in cell wall biosynthesis n=2 Tax=Kribbella kalugense TaxID=2512221 RepID=A0A4R7ZT35_9ACTN|nr:glycosyltransferase involved in cell wall biosynthesis [Kribbella kalugense]
MGETMTVTRSIREHLPAPLARTAGAVRRRLRGLRYSFAQLPAFPPVATTPVRMLVGPTNSAGQGHAWARAAKTVEGVDAVSFTMHRKGRFEFAEDYGVPLAWFGQPRWQRAQERYILTNCTHVMVESLRPIFGARGYPDAGADIAAMVDKGIDVALVFHGSDIRLPSRHAKRERWSPFTPGDELTERLEQQARLHAELVESLGLPVFVSTVDLLDDVPDAKWLPVAIDPAPWQQAARPLFSQDKPVVAHVPSNAKLKGTEEIDAVLTRLHDTGQIEYRRITGVPHAGMPAVIGDADIVVDQLRIGLYGVAAAEALAAGRIVVSYVGDAVRQRVRSLAGREVPIVEADPDTLGDVVTGLIAERGAAAERAAAGPGFVTELHDGRRSAEVLKNWLISKETL